MPYIDQNRRSEILIDSTKISNAGDLNYYITILVDQFIHNKGKSYAVINEVVGALECAKLELYRRVAAPYEDIKIGQNGDVYTV
jgi:hypothetical protein